VTDSIKYYSDQSKYKHCEHNYQKDLPPYAARGYVYFPQDGLIRLNVRVVSRNLHTSKQLKLKEIDSKWNHWSHQHPDLVDDYPVRW
ncbi:hypothetical protein MJH12_10660, partial [bacterium]|nr:hypothetical protein [bacterium]